MMLRLRTLARHDGPSIDCRKPDHVDQSAFAARLGLSTHYGRNHVVLSDSLSQPIRAVVRSLTRDIDNARCGPLKQKHLAVRSA